MFKILQKQENNNMLASCAIALFAVLFLWNFWKKGLSALGINFFLFLLLIFFLFNWQDIKEKKFFSHCNMVCQLPIFLIILSFLIYENPFIKIINLFVLPVLFIIFYNFSRIKNNADIYWDFHFINEIIIKTFSFLTCIDTTIKMYAEAVLPKDNSKRNVAKIIIGILIFLILAFILIIPLLSSADKEFAIKINFFYLWIKNLITFSSAMKFIVFCILSICLLAGLLAWQSVFVFKEKGLKLKNLDAIISGIVLCGILILYTLFLWVQIKRLVIGSLPIDFKETENLVKSGFWQLVVLSVMNIGFFAIYYKRTHLAVQKILNIFTVASLFLVVSAVWRMALYVLYYGFSYEKFFASYVVLFCIILFCWLVFQLFRNIKIDIIKFTLFLFLWMYGIIALFPTEQFILRANITLAKRSNSRINLYEMTMLSNDVFNLAKKNNLKWDNWYENRKNAIKNKKWYERNLTNLFVRY